MIVNFPSILWLMHSKFTCHSVVTIEITKMFAISALLLYWLLFVDFVTAMCSNCFFLFTAKMAHFISTSLVGFLASPIVTVNETTYHS